MNLEWARGHRGPAGGPRRLRVCSGRKRPRAPPAPVDGVMSWKPRIRPAGLCSTTRRRAVRGTGRIRRPVCPMVRAYLGARWRSSPMLQELDDAVQDVFVECLRHGGVLERARPGQPGGFRAYPLRARPQRGAAGRAGSRSPGANSSHRRGSSPTPSWPGKRPSRTSSTAPGPGRSCARRRRDRPKRRQPGARPRSSGSSCCVCASRNPCRSGDRPPLGGRPGVAASRVRPAREEFKAALLAVMSSITPARPPRPRTNAGDCWSSWIDRFAGSRMTGIASKPLGLGLSPFRGLGMAVKRSFSLR